MDKNIYKNYLAILREEMIPAMGCTEPIALAYGAARAREILGKEPERIVAKCSGNIIKNVRCVIIPNSGGLKGIPAGVILGAVAGDASLNMEVLSKVDEKGRARCMATWKEELNGGYECPFGLWDFSIPIVLPDGQVLGKVLVGQALADTQRDENILQKTAEQPQLWRMLYLFLIKKAYLMLI